MINNSIFERIRNRIINPILNIFYNFLVKPYICVCGSHDNRKMKYFISACLIFKDEAPFLKEWLDYHLTIGIDHFYLYDNNSTDDYRSIVQPYIEKGLVTLIHWPHQQAQAQCYKNCLETYKNESNWITYIDADEFIVPRHETDIKTWIKRYDKYPAIVIQWLMFGADGKVEHDYSKNVIEQYYACWEEMWRLGKCIVNTRFKQTNWNTQYFHHHAFMSYPFFGFHFSIPAVNQWKFICVGSKQWGGRGNKMKNRSIQINHYFTKSMGIYQEKMEKTDVFFNYNPKSMNRFFERDMKCLTKDYTITRFLLKMKINQGLI